MVKIKRGYKISKNIYREYSFHLINLRIPKVFELLDFLSDELAKPIFK